MGGALSLASASLLIPDIDAAVVYYGIPPGDNYENLKCPVLLHFGMTDDVKGFSDPESAQKLYQKLTKLNKMVNLRMYEGAGHAFSNKAGHNFNAQGKGYNF